MTYSPENNLSGHRRNGDILLPSDQAASISPELQEALREEGLTAMYDLNGSTIAQQKAKGNKFSDITVAHNSVLRVPSFIGTVAFDPRPDRLFLPNSNKLTLDERLEMTAEYSYKLQRKLGTQEIMAVLHEAPTYSAIVFAHFISTGQRLFGVENSYDFACTTSRTSESGIAIVGAFDEDRGFRVGDSDRDDRYEYVWAAPIVVSTAAVGP